MPTLFDRQIEQLIRAEVRRIEAGLPPLTVEQLAAEISETMSNEHVIEREVRRKCSR